MSSITNIGASSTTLLSNPTTETPPSVRRQQTGFAVASSKRNREFHQLFRSVPEDDYLIDDYSAALQRDILLHGRLYVSEGHICFMSNILGYLTNLAIRLDEILSVEKKSTAVIFPNAIVIQTTNARNVFASFVSRDMTYDLLIRIWRASHPNLKTSLNGVTVVNSEGSGDKTERVHPDYKDDDSIVDNDDVYDEDAEVEDSGSFVEPTDWSAMGSVIGSEPDISIGSEPPKPAGLKVPTVESAMPSPCGSAKPTDTTRTRTASVTNYPGPQAHPPTDCGDAECHLEKPLTDTTIPLPLGMLYSLMFGPNSGQFMRRWLIEEQQATDLVLEDDRKGLGEKRKNLEYSFTKTLNAAIGPKQTKCFIQLSLEQFDLERVVTVTSVAQTPDVPSGNAFAIKTRYCLMWGLTNSTRLIMNFMVDWNGKSWLKGPIEKGIFDGQVQYTKRLTAALRSADSHQVPLPVTAANATIAAGRIMKGVKSRNQRGLPNGSNIAGMEQSSFGNERRTYDNNSSLLRVVFELYESVAGIFPGVMGSRVIIALLAAWIVWGWLRQESTCQTERLGYLDSRRLAAYEEMWKGEESELWAWLEERMRMTGLEDG